MLGLIFKNVINKNVAPTFIDSYASNFYYLKHISSFYKYELKVLLYEISF